MPSAIKFVLKGKLNPYISGKDVILHIIGKIGVDGALYRSMEFTGEGVASLSMSDRLTMTNMAIEAGAKNGIFEVDDQTLAFVAEHSDRKPVVYKAEGYGKRSAEGLHRGWLRGIHPDLRSVSGRTHGHSGCRRACSFHHKPELRRQNGPPGI